MVPNDGRRLCVTRLVLLSLLLALLFVPWGHAAVIAPQSVLNPLPSFEPPILPHPMDVPGKEYSDYIDKDAAGTPQPGQIVHWAGNGTTVWDSFHYSIQSTGGSGVGYGIETDALANIRDKLFLDLDGTRDAVYDPYENRSGRDTVALVVSLQRKVGGPSDGYQNNIYASRSAYRGGGTQLWAHWQANINATAGALADLDGLEIYGPDQSDDADMFSVQSDPDADGNGRVSVFRFHPDQLNAQKTHGVSVPYLRTQVLLDALIVDGGSKPNWTNEQKAAFDLDALMVWDVGDDDQFDAGDKVLFSVRPIEGLFDGGEIWIYEAGQDKARFLVHGNYPGGAVRIWNTAHEVSMHFFGDGLHGENIDALEAVVPEPSSLALLLLGGLTVGALVLRRRLGPVSKTP